MTQDLSWLDENDVEGSLLKAAVPIEDYVELLNTLDVLVTNQYDKGIDRERHMEYIKETRAVCELMEKKLKGIYGKERVERWKRVKPYSSNVKLMDEVGLHVYTAD